MSSKFSHHPNKPKSSRCENAYTILVNAHGSASSFYDSFEALRKVQGKGTSTDEQQDLLRAMLVFASAGLDAMAKQLVRDALRRIVNRSEGANVQFRTFVHSKIKRGDGISDRLIADVLVSRTPRTSLISLLVDELTANSLQSADQILRVASYFDIPSKAICTDAKATEELRQVFQVRNQIIHEMDVAFDRANRSRHSRRRADMVGYANTIFDVANRFLKEVDGKLG